MLQLTTTGLIHQESWRLDAARRDVERAIQIDDESTLTVGRIAASKQSCWRGLTLNKWWPESGAA
jgi:hypothetical protein